MATRTILSIALVSFMSIRPLPAQPATTPDLIDKALADNCSGPLWENGIYPIIALPATAPTAKVMWEALDMSVYRGKLASFKILEVKNPHLTGSIGGSYTAALVETDVGQAVVVIRPQGKIGWWSRVIPIPRADAPQKSPN